MNKYYLSLCFLLLLISVQQSWSQSNKVGSKDCNTATQLCNNDVIDDQLLSQPGRIGANDVPVSYSSCFAPKTERNPFWYQFSPENNGTFEMYLNAPENKDFDFILFDVTNGCGSKTVLQCNTSQLDLDSNFIGTGVSTDSLNKYESDFPGIQNSWLSTLNVISGKKYAIYIESRQMVQLDTFQVTFGGSAKFRNIDAKFTANAPYCFGKPVVFTNLSTGSGAITYFWDFGDGKKSGATNPVHSYKSPGSYWVKLTAGNGKCTYKDSLLIDISITVVANAGSDVAVCSGKAVSLNASGGTIYSWSPSGGLSNPDIANPSASPTTTTTYTVTVSDVQGCKSTDNVVVGVNVNPLVDAGNDLSICSGDSVQLNATGAVTYSWSPSAGLSNTAISNPFAKPIGNTSYMVTGTDALGCTSQDLMSITLKAIPNVSAGADVNICLGNSTSLAAVGGVSYSWSPIAGLSNPNISSPSASPAITITYIVTGTGLNGCKNTDNVLVNVNALPIASAGVDVAICNGSSTSLSASGGINYSWSPASGLSNAAIANPIAQPTVTTNYIVTVTDVNGCINTDNIQVTVNTAPPINSGSDKVICEGDSTTLLASGATNYSWNPSNTLSNASIANPQAKPTVTTQYIVTGDNGGCPNSDTLTVFVNSKPIINAGNDVSVCNGKPATLGASGGINYIWTPASGLSATNIANPIANPTITTSYTVTATNNSGCSAKDNILVSVSANPTANAGNDISICKGTGMMLNATGGSTYSWSPSFGLSNSNIANPTANPAITTSYTVTVIDAGGCQATDVVNIAVNSLPIVNAGTDKIICNGDSTQLQASGAASYSWSSPSFLTSSNISNPLAYPNTTTNFVVTGNNGTCSNTDTVRVRVNASPVANAGIDASVCNGKPAQLIATGGTVYLWTPSVGLSNPNIFNPIANPTTTTNYSVRVTDANGCKSNDVVMVSITANPIVNAGADAEICIGKSTTLNANGGVNFVWSPSTGLSNPNIFNPDAKPLVTTQYIVKITDAGGCQATDSVTIVVNSLPIVTASNDDSTCIGKSIALSATGATNFVWSPSAGLSNPNLANPIASPTTSTNYTVTGTDAKGCSSTDQVLVKITNGSPLDAGSDQSFCFGKNTTLNASGVGTSYSWSPATGLSNPNILNPVATPTQNTKYTLSMTDNKGCTNVDSVLVSVNYISIKASNDTVLCSSNSLQLNASGGVTYSWSPAAGLSDPNIANPLATLISNTNYRVDITDASGCKNFDSVKVIVSSIPVVSTSNDTTICNGNSASLNASGGVSYSWSPAAGLSNANISNPIASPSANTQYIVTIAGVNGCTQKDTINIGVSFINISTSRDTSFCFGKSAMLSASGGSSYSWSPALGLSNVNISNPVASPSSSTNYQVTVTDAQGCKNSGSVQVNISYINTTLSNDTAFCKGGSANLLAGGGINYTWTPAASLSATNIANPKASPLSTTKYMVIIADATGCQNMDSATVVVNPLPNANAGNDTNVCKGRSVFLAAQGGVKYAWSPVTGQQDSLQSINVAPLATTNYTVKVIDALGCSQMDTVKVIVNFIVISVSPDTSICKGEPAKLLASGGVNYFWTPTTALSSDLVANPTASPANTTTYKVIVTDINGCQNQDSLTVTVNTLPTANAGADASVCLGKSVPLNAAGGTQFSWLPVTGLSNAVIPNPSAAPGATTTYVVEVTDAQGCKNKDSVVVNITTSVVGIATAVPDIFCSASPVLLRAVSGNGVSLDVLPYSFDGGKTFQAADAFNLSSVVDDTTARVMIKDLTGCLSDTISVKLFRKVFKATVTQVSPVTCSGLNNGIAQITNISGGKRPYTFFQNNTIPQTDSVFKNLASGQHLFFVKDQEACVSKYNISIDFTPSIASQVSKTNAKCFGGNDGKISIVAQGGSGQGFKYSFDGGTFSKNNNFNNVAVGQHKIVIKDSLICFDSVLVIVGSPSQLNVLVPVNPANLDCYGAQSGSVQFSASGGIAGYQYSLRRNSFQIDSLFEKLPGGNYKGFVMDANGCKDSIDFTIKSPDSLYAAFKIAQQPKCGGMGGILLVDSIRGGTPNYRKIVNGGAPELSDTLRNFLPGIHVITITDKNGCFKNYDVIFDADSNAIRGIAQVDSTNCFGSADGKISLINLSGGVRPYAFSIGDTLKYQQDSSMGNLAKGTYKIFAKNGNNCVSQFTALVRSPEAIAGKAMEQVNISCYQFKDGKITLQASGGNGSYSYSLNNKLFSLGNQFTNLSQGKDSIYIQDRKSCKGIFVSNILEPDSLFANVSQSKPSSCQGGDGVAKITLAKGGTGSLVFSINNGISFQSDSLFKSLSSGVYTLLIQDANKCSKKLDFEIQSVPKGLDDAAIRKNTTDIACKSDGKGSVVLSNFKGAPSPYMFALDTLVNFSLDSTFKNLEQGQHEIKIKDGNFCNYKISISISKPDTIGFEVQVLKLETCNNKDGQITVTNVVGASGKYKFQIENKDFQTSNVFANLNRGVKIITVSDSSLPTCSTKQTIMLNQKAGPRAFTTKFSPSCYKLSNGHLQIDSIKGGLAPYMFSISGEDFSNSMRFENMPADTFSLFIKDSECAEPYINLEPLVKLNNQNKLDTTYVPYFVIAQPAALTAETFYYEGFGEENLATSGVYNIQGGTKPYFYSLNDTTYKKVITDTLLISGLTTGSHLIYLKDSNACVQQVVLNIGRSFLIPNLFTPNGDDKNQYFVINGLRDKSSLSVVNRWGSQVYMSDDYDNSWDGKNCPDGVYYYELKIPEVATYKGWIQISRGE